MDIDKIKGAIEAILFSAGRGVTKNELLLSLEISTDDLETIIASMQSEYEKKSHGIELLKIDNAYQLCTKKEFYEDICNVVDKRVKPKISNASMETLAIIAYNPRICRAEIEAIRGVNVDACIYKLLEYNLIEESGKLDLPGKPMSYKTTSEFLKMFGYSNLNELPELPKYKLDENRQIVIDELEENVEAPLPEREIQEEKIEQK